MARSSFEKTVLGAIGELGRVVGEDRVGAALGSLVEGVARTKATVDSNMETVLGMANLPSRAELQRIEHKLEAVQRVLMNLTRKVDRLVEVVEARDETPPRRKAPSTSTTRKRGSTAESEPKTAGKGRGAGARSRTGRGGRQTSES